jgi:hypothetical protein
MPDAPARVKKTWRERAGGPQQAFYKELYVMGRSAGRGHPASRGRPLSAGRRRGTMPSAGECLAS